MKRVLVVLILAIAVSRCDHEEEFTGPCVHVYEEPVLNVLSVTNRATNQRLDAVWVRQVAFEGEDLDLLALRQSVSYRVSYTDSGLYCNPPFGFGTANGHYTLSISADGFRDTVVTVSAAYSIYRGGCPSSNSGGTKFVVQLKPL